MLNVPIFCERFEVSVDSVHVAKYLNRYPASIFEVNYFNELMIDEKFFIKRCDFKTRVIQESHEFYYFFTRHLKESDFARMIYAVNQSVKLSGWNEFINSKLFSFKQDRIFDYKIAKRLWNFWRVCRWCAMRMCKSLGVKFSMKKITEIIEKD